MTDRAPLDDPAYIPEHPPINGIIPPIVARWGPASQRRWFRRYWGQLVREQAWGGFYWSSEHHVNGCCERCGEAPDEWFPPIPLDDWCCCRDERAKR